MLDAIVIGAGPCGCTAAATLAKNGWNVLLFEKCKLPRYKSCSGILIEKSLRFIERQFGRNVPDSVTCTPVQNRGMVFVKDDGREYKFENRGLNIWRDKFDYWLVSLAREAGVRVRDGSTVSHVRESGDSVCVSVNGENVFARFVIDCSGAVGIGAEKHKSIVTYQTYNRGTIALDPHYFYAYLQPELSGYDAWFNVKDEMLVLGVGAPCARDIGRYYERFTAYLREKHGLCIDKQLKSDRWLIRRISSDYAIDCGSGRILKAGETAGFLNPMGEGISSAMESGVCAALAVSAHFKDSGKALEDYKNKVAEIEDYMRRQWRLVGRMSDKFSFMLST